VAGSFIAGSESEEASLPLVQEMMFILRNTGRYEEAYGMVERYGSVSADWDFSWMKEILSAYTGKPAQALLMCEKKWDGTDACIYAKALYLLKMGLYDDAMAAASEGSVGDDDEDVHWIYVLYLIELARYWKNADDETKATEAYAQARKYMDKVHMGMCEYEASGLGLEI
jgi:tetratricopeptide (TPR) repeat protein